MKIGIEKDIERAEIKIRIKMKMKVQDRNEMK